MNAVQSNLFGVAQMRPESKLAICRWSEEDRPRIKMQRQGAQSLTNAELLSIIVGSGSTEEDAVHLCARILGSCGNNLRQLGRLTIHDLMQFHGIGSNKATAILAAIELGNRREQEKALEKSRLDNATAIHRYLRPSMGCKATEEARLLLMNNRLELIKDVTLSNGGLTETAVDIRLIVREAVIANATAVVLAHNHPSGNYVPSGDDDRLTKRVGDALKLMRICFVDHIIITDMNYYSYQEHGRL